MYRTGIHAPHLTDEQAVSGRGVREATPFVANSKLASKNNSLKLCEKPKKERGKVGSGLAVRSLWTINFTSDYHVLLNVVVLSATVVRTQLDHGLPVFSCKTFAAQAFATLCRLH